MTIKISSINQNNGIEVSCSGIIYGKDIIALQGTKTPDEIKRTRYMIIDFTDVVESYITHNEVMSIVHNDIDMLRVNPEMYIVHVVSNEIFILLSTLYMSCAEEYISNIKHFETRDEANYWIENNVMSKQ